MSQLKQFLTALNEQQQQAVQHQQGPAVVLAGAGSGKTRVLTTRAAWLIDQHQIQPNQILLMTFTNKAAGEMNQRIQQITGYQLPYSGTFHSFCARLLRKQGRHIGLNPDYLIYDSSDQAALLRQIYKDLEINKSKYKPKAIKSIISSAKNDMTTADEYSQQASDSFQQTVARIYKAYQRYLHKRNAVDFDDLLLKTVQLLQTQSEILDQYQQKLIHVMVDEYQDTNKAQYKLTKLLAQPQNNVYVVGDFSQSIYAWRGADYRNLFYLKQDYQNMAEYRLERNYRSTQPILSAATKLIANNTTHPVLELWTDKESEDKLTVIECETSDAEAQMVTDMIKNQLTTSKQKYTYNDVAILYRTNAQSRAFEEAFIQAGIPYRLVGGFKFYERKEIKDVLAYLRYTINPLDDVSHQRLLKIGKRRFRRYQQWIKSQQKNDELDLDSPYDLLKGILKSSQYLAKYDDNDPEDEERIQNVQELLNVAAKFQDAILFLENVSLVQDNQLKDLPLGQEEDKVTLMSLHSAKGLEFPVVFMVGMEEGLLPHSHALFDAEQLEEERRLCYVGITRAQQKLIFSYARQRWLYGRSSQATPSRFLSQIPPKLVQRKQFVGEVGNYRSGNSRRNSSASSNYTNSSHKSRSKRSHDTKDSKSNRKYRIGIEIDEDDLDALLKDEIDVEEFLRS